LRSNTSRGYLGGDVDRDRLRKIRNYQNTEFYPALVLRPASVAITYVVGDWAWVTPNRVTAFATLLKFIAAAMLCQDDRALLVGGVIVLQLGAIFDHVDGTLARYRQQTSNLGFFYDTVSDAVTWFLTLMALGWVAFGRTGEAYMLVVAGAAAYALMVNGYMRSVVETAAERKKWRVAAVDPTTAKGPATKDGSESELPPERTRADWVKWFGKVFSQIWRFQEMDLFFWVAVGVWLDRIPELIWLMAATQCAAMLVQFAVRAKKMQSFD
jgi:phosphatidylglycerophosphate synthase